MSKQKDNFKQACKGGSISTIHSLLHLQSQSILDELMKEYQTASYEELAIRLSLGE